MLLILETWLFSSITWNKMWFITQLSDPKMHKEISTVNTGKLVHLTQLIYNLWIQCICKVVLLPTKNDYIHKYIGISRMCEHSTNLCLAFPMFIVQNKAISMTVDTKTITLSDKLGTSMTWRTPVILWQNSQIKTFYYTTPTIWTSSKNWRKKQLTGLSSEQS